IFVDPETNEKEGPGADPVAWHRPQGVFVASGPGIKRAVEVSGISLLDIAPTALALLGIPIGEDFDGSPATHIFDPPISVSTITPHEPAHTDDGVRRAEFVDDPYAAQEVLKQLVELGYVEPPGADASAQLDSTLQDRKRNLAQMYVSTGRFTRAIEV